jgi:CDP-glucose 4,6-dehydratase
MSTSDHPPRPSRPDPGFWSGRRVVVTGHAGFKGSWLTCWLRNLGAEVHGVSLPEPPSDPCLWDQLQLSGVADHRHDIASTDWQADVRSFDPEVVLHLAMQPLVSVGYQDPGGTFRSNVQGTVNVLSLLADLPALLATVVITTDKVYDVRQPAPYTEDAFLGGKDPYSASKAAAELVVHSWPESGGPPVATARAGNVIGGGDWALDRIVPDLVRAWSAGDELVLRRPDAVRPWQHVVEPLAGYLVYAQALATRADLPGALNFGPDDAQAVQVVDLVDRAAEVWRRLVPGSTPTWRFEPQPDLVETGLLTLDSTLAGSAIGWRSRWDWQEAISRTIEWYVATARGADPAAVTRAQIAEYGITG